MDSVRVANMEECQKYFKSRSVFRKLFQKTRQKYESLGRLAGTMRLDNLTEKERKDLGGFFQKDYKETKTVFISTKMLEQTLKNSKFAEFSWEEILEQFFQEPLVSNKEIEQKQQQEKQEFFQNIDLASGKLGKQWMESVLREKGKCYYTVIQNYKKDKAELEQALKSVLKAVDHLPILEKKRKRLDVFAASITGNPHYFDEGTLGERLLSAFLQFYFDLELSTENYIEQKRELFYRAGILKDELSNYVLTYGIIGTDEDGRIHAGLKGFCERKEAVLITLQLLEKLSKATSKPSSSKIIYVVENPSIFSVLMEYKPDCSALCTYGQPKLATFVLMDLLAEENQFYYAGDFDPEGLLIAQSLKQRYGASVIFWNYLEAYYMENLSQVNLSEKRLKKLEKISIKELQPIKKLMEKEKKAVYQEKIFDAHPEISI